METVNLGDPLASNTVLVDKYIGAAYPIVRAVAAELVNIRYLAENLTELRPRGITLRSNDTTQAIEWKYTDDDGVWTTLVLYSALTNVPISFATYTLSTLPSASDNSGKYIEVSNASGGPKVCRSNGTVWQLLNTTTTVS